MKRILKFWFFVIIIAGCNHNNSDWQNTTTLPDDDWFKLVNVYDTSYYDIPFSLIKKPFRDKYISQLEKHEFIIVDYDSIKNELVNTSDTSKFCFVVRGLFYEGRKEDDFALETNGKNILVIFGALGDGNSDKIRMPIFVSTDFIPDTVFTWCVMDR